MPRIIVIIIPEPTDSVNCYTLSSWYYIIGILVHLKKYLLADKLKIENQNSITDCDDYLLISADGRVVFEEVLWI